MNCQRCGYSPWRVDRSVHADGSHVRRSYQKSALERVDALLVQYTYDYHLRRRTCPKCGEQAFTLELTLEDLEAVIQQHVERLTPPED